MGKIRRGQSYCMPGTRTRGMRESFTSDMLPNIRLKELADKEQDVDKKMGLRKVFRSLQGVDEEVKRYNGVLKKFADARDDEWEAIVAVHRGDLQKAFFEHLQVGGDTVSLLYRKHFLVLGFFYIILYISLVPAVSSCCR